ncbi:glycoside hydrolase family 13 protein [uncultured Pseudokineococcus sp.]|uniref:glycoside hydrolase family 13 protein n=1 Tax=uncultured Pseudokineococcus sp. TaxID=1642928 RepID=UPI002630E6B7|nr:glycoside hydrolase family 13 protein [uncultured Pseudokineococcus sp.]
MHTEHDGFQRASPPGDRVEWEGLERAIAERELALLDGTAGDGDESEIGGPAGDPSGRYPRMATTATDLAPLAAPSAGLPRQRAVCGSAPAALPDVLVAGGTADGWWRDAVVYQVYLRSFADADADGVGDLAGLRARLPHLAWLGVDALWITPHYPSGGADGGYDVCDYRDVDPELGTVDDVRLLVEDAHALGLRVLLDVVPNHTSDRHPWFEAALADPSSEHARKYVFAPASPEPPNNWVSLFGGSAWSRTPDGRWYLHLFSPEQPDLDWREPSVAEDFEETLRFWLDLGVDGFRVDVAYGLFKDPELRDNPGTYSPTLFGHGDEQRHTWDQAEVHTVWRRWRALVDSYEGTGGGRRMLVGEVCLADLDRVAAYVRPDEMHQAFAFRLLKSPWDAASFAEGVCSALTAFDRVGAPVSWVLGNHDKDRQVTRFGGGAHGLSRARAAAMLVLALPGSPYLYAGEELGLPQVVVPDEAKQDPIFHRSGGLRAGRDGCRIPMPWSTGPAAGFSGERAVEPWLPQPEAWDELSVERQAQDPTSTLWLYRTALVLRRELRALGGGRASVERSGDVLAVHRGDEATGSLTCWVNMGHEAVAVPCAGDVVLASEESVTAGDGWVHLPASTAVWVSEPARA